MLPPNITEFVKTFTRLPGVGAKTAQRLGFYLISQPEELSRSLANSITKLRQNAKVCSLCGNISDSDPCWICRESSRVQDLICVVETPADLYMIEETGSFNGLYLVLGGVISPLDGVTTQDLNFDLLRERVRKNQVKEIVLALSPTTEGDTTALYIKQLFANTEIKITMLARGIPVGTAIQYAGRSSLAKAIRHREEL